MLAGGGHLGKRTAVMLLCVVVLALGVPASASAYVYSGNKWATTSVKYFLSASLSSTEKSCVTACGTIWNNGPSAWTLTNSNTSGVYNGWSKTSFSYHSWPDVPGMTARRMSGSTIVENDSWINTDFSWNNSGVMDKAARNCDYKTVMLHEFGHWIRLLEDTCHSSAVMWPNWTTKQALTQTDKDGLDYVY